MRPEPLTQDPTETKSGGSHFIVAAVGGVLLLAAVIAGVVWTQKVDTEQTRHAAEEAKTKEVAEGAELMAEGNRLVATGAFAAGLGKYREAARRGPTSVAARDAIARAEQLLVVQQTSLARTKEVERHVAAAREAELVANDPRAIAEAESALAIDPENGDARMIRDSARGRLASRGAAEGRKAAVEAREEAKPTRRPPPPAPLQAVRPPPVARRYDCRESAIFNLTPEDIEITIDGQPIGTADRWDGRLPEKVYRFRGPGVHYVKLSHPSYETVWLDVNVDAGAIYRTADVEMHLSRVRVR